MILGEKRVREREVTTGRSFTFYNDEKGMSLNVSLSERGVHSVLVLSATEKGVCRSYSLLKVWKSQYKVEEF